MIAFTFFGDGNGSGMTVLGLAFYLIFFSVGMGPGAWLIPSEVFPSSIRSKSMSVATFFNRLTATAMASTFLSTSHWLGLPGFFVLLALVALVVAGFVYFFLPETKGRSLEDMALYFAEITQDRSILDAEERVTQQRGGSVEMSSGTSQQPQPGVAGTMA